MMLDKAPFGVALTVESSRVEPPATSRRMAQLGIRTGASVSLLGRTSGGGAIVAIGDDRLALSRDVLRGIQVQTGGPTDD